MDRLKEEKEEIYQQKQKLKWMAEVEIERLKEELLQQKERDDLLRAQTNRSLKDKHVDFEKLYQDHKELEKEFDRQHERLREVWANVKEKNESLMLLEKLFEETKMKMSKEAEKEKALPQRWKTEEEVRKNGKHDFYIDFTLYMYRPFHTLVAKKSLSLAPFSCL